MIVMNIQGRTYIKNPKMDVLKEYKAKRVALVVPRPLNLTTSSLEAASKDIADMLTKFGMHVEIFSLSGSDSSSHFYSYKQNRVKVSCYGFDKPSILRFIDFLGFGIFGFKLSIESISRSKHLARVLYKYKPDIIFVTDSLFAKMVQNYKHMYYNSGVKVMAYVDAPDIEFNFSLTKNITSTNSSSFLSRYLKKLLEKKHFRYQTAMYNTLVNVSDAIITPGRSPKERIVRNFPAARNKIFPFLVNYVRGNGIRKQKRAQSIKTILFLSSYGSAPYVEAMDYIRSKLAPEFPEMVFIIHGRDCPDRTVGNVIFSNKYLPLRKLFKEVDLCISPLPRKNPGIKLKVFDYFATGKMVIGTSESFKGFKVLDKFNAIIEDNINVYPDRIRELNENKELMNRIQANVHTALRGHYEKDIYDAWSDVLRYIYKPTKKRT